MGMPVMSVACSCGWTIDGREGRASFAPYFSRPPTYSDAISRDSSTKSTFHSRVGAFCGGPWQLVSMKLRRRPRLHWRLDLRQFWQMGAPSSHLRWRSRHVKHPVRTRFGLDTTAAPASGAGTSPLPVGAVMGPEGRSLLVLEAYKSKLALVRWPGASFARVVSSQAGNSWRGSTGGCRHVALQLGQVASTGRHSSHRGALYKFSWVERDSNRT